MKSIEVVIAGRSFPLKVTEEEEALVLQVIEEINEKVHNLQNIYLQKDKQDCLSILQVIEEINEKVHNLQNIYLQKDKQDCLSMALLTYALETAKLKNDLAGLNELREVSDQIENSILRITL